MNEQTNQDSGLEHRVEALEKILQATRDDLGRVNVKANDFNDKTDKIINAIFSEGFRLDVEGDALKDLNKMKSDIQDLLRWRNSAIEEFTRLGLQVYGKPGHRTTRQELVILQENLSELDLGTADSIHVLGERLNELAKDYKRDMAGYGRRIGTLELDAGVKNFSPPGSRISERVSNDARADFLEAYRRICHMLDVKPVDAGDLFKTTLELIYRLGWKEAMQNVKEYFTLKRKHENLGLGDIKLTVAEQEEIINHERDKTN